MEWLAIASKDCPCPAPQKRINVRKMKSGSTWTRRNGIESILRNEKCRTNDDLERRGAFNFECFRILLAVTMIHPDDKSVSFLLHALPVESRSTSAPISYCERRKMNQHAHVYATLHAHTNHIRSSKEIRGRKTGSALPPVKQRV